MIIKDNINCKGFQQDFNLYNITYIESIINITFI